MNTAVDVQKLTAIDLTPTIGSELKIDAEALLSGRHAAEIREILERRGVVVVKEIGITDEELRAFGKTLGELQIQAGVEDELLQITLDKEQFKNAPWIADYLKGSWYWHIDQTTKDVPNLATILVGRKLSETGGETEFVNTYAAWDALPEDEKRQYDGLRVVHSLEVSQRYIRPEPTYEELKGWQKYPSKVHPLVWTHQSGRKSLVLGSTASHIEGMGLEEGRLLLAKLREWATQPQFLYQHRWTVGDLVMWDNTGTMHRALPYPEDSGRRMSRIVLQGEEALV